MQPTQPPTANKPKVKANGNGKLHSALAVAKAGNQAASVSGQGAGQHSGAHLDRPDDLARDRFSISDLTHEFNCTARALRFYEDEGLIAPSRVGLTRIYSKRDRARLAWIMRAKNVGFSLTEIREMIDLYDLGDGRVEQRRFTIKKCRDHVAKLKDQKADIESSILELSDFIAMVENEISDTAKNITSPEDKNPTKT